MPSGTSGRWEGWRFAFAMYAVAVAGCTFLSFGLGYLVGQPGTWNMSNDVWWTTQSAQYVAWGGLGSVYAANPWFSALPGFLILLAPVAALGSHLGLVSGAPFPLPRPSLWLLVGPYFFLVGSTAVLAVDYLCFTLQISRPRRKALAAGTALLVVAPTPGLAGHPEDLLALALVCLALARLVRHRTTEGAWLLGAAILVQTWAVLLIPLFVVAAPPGNRLRTLLRSTVLAAVTGVLVLAADFQDAFLDLFRQPMPNDGQRLPWMTLAGHLTVHYNQQSIVMVAGSTTRSLAVVVSVLLALAIRKNVTPGNIILVGALALFARVFFEVEYWPYYVAPAAVLLAVLGAHWTPGRSRRFGVAAAGAFLMYASAPMSYRGISYNSFIALFVLLATLATVLAAAVPTIGWRISFHSLGSDAASPAHAQPAGLLARTRSRLEVPVPTPTPAEAGSGY